jgi:hypothetical protein
MPEDEGFDILHNGVQRGVTPSFLFPNINQT